MDRLHRRERVGQHRYLPNQSFNVARSWRHDLDELKQQLVRYRDPGNEQHGRTITSKSEIPASAMALAAAETIVTVTGSPQMSYHGVSVERTAQQAIRATSIPNRSRCTSFTMIEALVALVVLSIGFLGVAGLQLTGLHANSSAASRSQASYLADDIINRMRADRTEALSQQYNIARHQRDHRHHHPKLDLIAWQADLTSLPVGKGSVAVDTVTGIATVSVQWVDSRGGDSNLCTGAQLDVCSPLTFVTATPTMNRARMASSAGFTLVELMVSMTISLVLLGGAVSILYSSN